MTTHRFYRMYEEGTGHPVDIIDWLQDVEMELRELRERAAKSGGRSVKKHDCPYLTKVSTLYREVQRALVAVGKYTEQDIPATKGTIVR